MAAPPYHDPEYRAALAVLAEGEHRCAWCGAQAVTPDHLPALADHVHVRGSGCCRLLPACRRCQSAGGAAIANRRRRAASRARAALAPGSSLLDRAGTLDAAGLRDLSPGGARRRRRNIGPLR